MASVRRRRVSWRFAVLLVAFVGACNAIVGIDEPIVVGAGTPCVLNSDCPRKSDVCLFKVCSPRCLKDRDCEPGARCLQAQEGTACVVAGLAACSTGEECPSGTVCSGGACRKACDGGVGCLEDQSCTAQSVCQGTDTGHEPAIVGNLSTDGAGGKPSPSSGGATSGGTMSGGAAPGGAAGAPAVAECQPEGLKRCDGMAQARRSICQAGRWVSEQDCPAGELCDSAVPGALCQAVPPACVGQAPGQPFCSTTSRTICGPDLVSAMVQACTTTQHCALGTGGNCAACLPNEYRCDGDSLMKCRTDNTGFEPKETCTASDPCNAGAGACTILACLVAGALRCNGDNLERCNQDRMGFTPVAACAPGMCDAVALECDKCTPDSVGCLNGSQQKLCSSNGQIESTPACPIDKPFCQGSGVCVACTTDTNCMGANECQTGKCNTGTAACYSSPKNAGTKCANDTKVCDTNGNCVQCYMPTDCPPPGECYTATCVNNICGQTPKSATTGCSGGKVCDGNGACVQCLNAGTCTAPGGECYTATCVNNSCGQTKKTSGIGCASNGGTVCDGNGACVQCVNTGMCTAPGGECYTATCVNNTCGQTPKSAPTGCSGGKVCDGGGACVQCVSSAQCVAQQVCRTNACVTALHPVGNAVAFGATSTVIKDNLYVFKLPALAYPAKLLAFGAIGTAVGPAAKMVLYADNGAGTAPSGIPLAITSAALGLASTAAEQSPNSANVMLAAGTIYWLGIVTNVDTTIRSQANAAAKGTRIPQLYADPLPNGSLGFSYNGQDWNVYVKVEDTQ